MIKGKAMSAVLFINPVLKRLKTPKPHLQKLENGDTLHIKVVKEGNILKDNFSNILTINMVCWFSDGGVTQSLNLSQR